MVSLVQAKTTHSSGNILYWSERLPRTETSVDGVDHLPEDFKDFVLKTGGKVQREMFMQQSNPPVVFYRACWADETHGPHEQWIDILK